MASITLTDEARRCLVLFEDVTGADARDCVVEDDHDRIVVVVAPGQMGKAIGPGGQTVQKVRDKLGRDVKLVEYADTAEAFVANCLAPAAVHNVTISEGGEGDDTVAYAEVDDADTGVAIGANGRTIETARMLARRHYDVAAVELV